MARAETQVSNVWHGFRVHSLDEYRIHCYTNEIKHSNQPPAVAAFLLPAPANHPEAVTVKFNRRGLFCATGFQA
jgi:hypothetical protein